MGIKQKINDAKQEYRDVYAEAKNHNATESTQPGHDTTPKLSGKQAFLRGYDTAVEKRLQKREVKEALAERRAQKAAKKLLENQQVAREFRDQKYWDRVRRELKPYTGHLIVFRAFGGNETLAHEHAAAVADAIAAKVRKDVPIGFTKQFVYKSDDELYPAEMQKWHMMQNMQILAPELTRRGFKRTSINGTHDKVSLGGLNISAFEEVLHQTKYKAAELGSRDYQLLTMINGDGMASLGLDEDTAGYAPMQLAGFDESGRPVWANLTSPEQLAV